MVSKPKDDIRVEVGWLRGEPGISIGEEDLFLKTRR
jgi:hypothetical protein